MANEWSLEFSDARGFSGSLRLTVRDRPQPAIFDARLSLPDDGVVVVHDDDVTPPRRESQLVVRAEGLWAELLCETPDEHWSFGLEAFGVQFDDEAQAAVSDRGERVAVGFDLEWETPDRVYGEILLGRRQFEFDGHGRFAT